MPGNLATLAMSGDGAVAAKEPPKHSLAMWGMGLAEEPKPNANLERATFAPAYQEPRFLESSDLLIPSRTSVTGDASAYAPYQAESTSPLDYAGELSVDVFRGAAGGTGQALAGTGRAIENAPQTAIELSSLRKFMPLFDKDVREFAQAGWKHAVRKTTQPMKLVGSAIQQGVTEEQLPTPATGPIAGGIAEAVGTSLPGIVAAVAGGPLGIAGYAGSAQYENTFQQVKELGGTEREARIFAAASGLVGAATEPMMGVEKTALNVLRKADKVTLGWLGKQILKAAPGEAGEEIVQEIPDEVARHAYTDRKFWDSVTQLAKVGALGGTVGLILGSVVSAPAMIKAAREGRSKLLTDHQERVEAGQADPMPSANAFDEAGLGRPTRKERPAIIEQQQEIANAETKTTEASRTEAAPEGAKGQKAEVNAVLNLTPELVESTQQQMRDAIKNPDLSPKQRADSIANLRQLVNFVSQGGTVETDYFKGDKVAFTGNTGTPAGFREFIYLEGPKAGAYGEMATKATRNATVERNQQEFQEQQEEFRRLRQPQAPQGEGGEGVAKQPSEPAPPAARPDLANPGIESTVRTAVDQVDVARNRRGAPVPETVEGHKAEAKRRLEIDYQGELDTFLGSEPRPLDAVETWLVRDLIETETLQSQLSDNLERQERAQELIDKYRETGTKEALGFAARRDLVMTPAMRMGEALTEPPEKVQVEIKRIKKQAAKERERATTGLGKKAKEARKELGDSLDELGRYLSGRGFANPLADPELIRLSANVVAKAVKAGTLSFADFIAETTRKIGADRVRKLAPVLQREWENARKANNNLKPVVDIEIAIKQASKKIKEDDRISALRKGWARRARDLKQQLKAAGYDIDAVLQGKADPTAAMQAVAQVEAAKASMSDKWYEFWISSILSGPLTQLKNVAGSLYNFGKQGFVDRFAQATLDSAARLIGVREGGARFGEFKPLVKGTLAAWGLASKNFTMVWRSDMSQFNAQRGRTPSSIYDYRSPKIAGTFGRVVRTPLRSLVAADDAMKTLIAGGETAARAYRAGIEEGLSGEALERRMMEIIADPTSTAYIEGTDRAIEYAFQEETPRIKQVAGLIKSIPGARYKIPFIVTLSNLLRIGIRSTPAGSLALARRLINASKTGDWTGIDERVAEQVVGLVVILGLACSIDEKDPWITGTEDRNRPQSFRFPFTETWVSYAAIEPLATMLGISVDTIMKWKQGGDAFDIAKAPFESVLKQIDTKSFMEGVSDILKALEYRSINPVLEWAAKFPSSWIPNLIRQPVRALDDEVPERRIYGKGTERLVVMAKRGLQATEFVADFPKYDLWGRPVPRDGGPLQNTDFVFRVFSPAQVKEYQPTIGDRVIQSWNAHHPDDPIVKGKQPPQRDYKVDGKTFYMNDDEYAEYVRSAGAKSLDRVERLHRKTPFDLDNPTKPQKERIENIIEDERASAKRALLKKKKAG